MLAQAGLHVTMEARALRAVPLRTLPMPAGQAVCNRGASVVAAARRQARKRKDEPVGPSRTLDQRISFGDESTDYEPGPRQAPSPGTRELPSDHVGPEQIYPVFAPKPGQGPSDAPWRWDDEDKPRPENAPSDVPAWNPKTGFMRSAADLQQSAAASSSSSTGTSSSSAQSGVSSAGSSSSSSSSSSGGGFSSSAGQRSGGVASSSGRSWPQVSLNIPDPDALQDLPSVSKGAVLSNALGTGFWMITFAIFLRQFAATNAFGALGTDPELLKQLLRYPAGLESLQEVGITVAAVVLVTGARLQLMQWTPEFRTATERSNKQVLTPLGWIDIAVVGLASGLPEELLFRGGIIPATFPDWRGVFISSAIFGLLHNSGGRNVTFAAWATAVGGVYGGVYLLTQNVWAPAAAHVLANFASAALYKTTADARDATD